MNSGLVRNKFRINLKKYYFIKKYLNMDLSYWELKLVYKYRLYHCRKRNCWFAAALRFAKIPDSKILVLGMLPQGASTKNAGFACFEVFQKLLMI
jgi:hypothetical protein